jgi:glutaredoxin-dependent peroxiredoxin
MLGVGDRIPDGKVWLAPRESAAIPDLVADGPALFLFFLVAWSSTWTNELELLRDRRTDFEQAGVQTFAVSRDSPYTLVAWSQALDLDVPLVSDWNADATRGFGVGYEYRGMKDVAERTAFLVAGDGTVRNAWRYEEAGEVPDFDELLAAAQAL